MKKFLKKLKINPFKANSLNWIPLLEYHVGGEGGYTSSAHCGLPSGSQPMLGVGWRCVFVGFIIIIVCTLPASVGHPATAGCRVAARSLPALSSTHPAMTPPPFESRTSCLGEGSGAAGRARRRPCRAGAVASLKGREPIRDGLRMLDSASVEVQAVEQSRTTIAWVLACAP